MKVLAVLLLATYALGHQQTRTQSEWRQFYNFAVNKAMESCLGKDNVNKYTVNLKKAVAKCQQQDAPELDLPPYRSMYKFVNTIINSADDMDQYKLHRVFNMLRVMSNSNPYENYDRYNSGSDWMRNKWMKYKMHQMMKEMMYEDNDSYDSVRPYSSYYSNNKMDMMDHNMDKFEMMKMMKEVMRENNHQESFDKFQMMKMMKKFFGSDHGSDKYEMMEQFFKKDDYKMEPFDMMKMMMKFSDDKIDMSEMMHKMEKMYGDKFTMTGQDKYSMMKNFDQKDVKNFEYSPPQARYRYKRQASGSTKPVDYTKPAPLDRGDRLFAKLQEQKREHEAYVGNLTCVLRETDVLNRENEIDVNALKKNMKQYNLPGKWFSNKFEKLIDTCHETAVNLPAEIVDEHIIEGDFGTVKMAHVKVYMKCLKEGKQKLCMDLDTKNKIESNFGPIETILKETKLTEHQLFPLVQEMLQGEESDYMGFM